MSVVYKQIVTDDLTGETAENANYITVNFFWKLVSGSAYGNGDTPDSVGTFLSYANALTWVSQQLVLNSHYKRDDNVWALYSLNFSETQYSGADSLMLTYNYLYLVEQEAQRDASR